MLRIQYKFFSITTQHNFNSSLKYWQVKHRLTTAILGPLQPPMKLLKLLDYDFKWLLTEYYIYLLNLIPSYEYINWSHGAQGSVQEVPLYSFGAFNIFHWINFLLFTWKKSNRFFVYFHFSIKAKTHGLLHTFSFSLPFTMMVLPKIITNTVNTMFCFFLAVVGKHLLAFITFILVF